MPDLNELLSLVDSFSGVRVLVVGDAMLDHYIVGSVDRISPEAPVPILKVEHEFDRVGGAANVAANIVALGGSATLLALGGFRSADTLDPDGMRLEEKCRSLGIGTIFVPGLPCTTRKARMVAGRQQMLRVDWEYPYCNAPDPVPAGGTMPFSLGAEEARLRDARLRDALGEADVVLVSDYAKGMVDAALFEVLHAAGKPILVDPRPRHAPLYKGVTLVTPNRKEATEMLGASVGVHPEASLLAARLVGALGCHALVTLGAEGMFLRTTEGTEEAIPTRAQEVYDVTGAGDTVVATMALAMGAGADLSAAAHLANAAAGVVVGHIGTASVTPGELRASLSATESGGSS